MKLKYLTNLWDKKLVEKLNEAEILRYRSNLLGSDLRITNFGGGNTSSKIFESDPISGKIIEVLWVKGSGGDLGSIGMDGFARLYMSKFNELRNKYRGKRFEDEMVEYYPLCAFGLNTRPASIDTPLHGLIPFKHVDHLHTDWATALAAAANGQRLLDDFNKQFNMNLFWVPWQRPGYELGIMIRDLLKKNPKSRGAIMASHGLITWSDNQYGCYINSLEVTDALGQFVLKKVTEQGKKIFGGNKYSTIKNSKNIVNEIFPFLRGQVGHQEAIIGHFDNSSTVMRFVNSKDAKKLAFQGTSCPDHFLRTKIRPMFIDWDPKKDSIDILRKKISQGLIKYKIDYSKYYSDNKDKNSPSMRDPNPKVVLITGIGMFSFGKNKKEARITSEFFNNAIHVMEGATGLKGGRIDKGIDRNRVVNNYLALSSKEAFRIEYWALEEAKLRRQPKEAEFSRKVVIVVGGGSGVGRDFCNKLVANGAHIIIADKNINAANESNKMIQNKFGNEFSHVFSVDIVNRASVTELMNFTKSNFGGVDVLVNTAAIFLPPDNGETYFDKTWNKILNINITGNNILAEEFAKVIQEQNSEGQLLFTSSANAIVPKHGSEPYDVSKTALNHLIRELAIRYAPHIRVNGVSPATVVEGSSMFPRDRVIASLSKYNIHFGKNEPTKELVGKLSNFYSKRTLTHKPIRPSDVVEAGYFLLSRNSSRITGHIIPVDGGLVGAFFR